MDRLKDKLMTLSIAYDEIADNYNNEIINTKVTHIKNSINELSETLNVLSKLFGEKYGTY